MNPKPQSNFKQYKIKKEGASHGVVTFGFTVPQEVAREFLQCKFTIEITKDAITYKSGTDLANLRDNINQIKFEDII